MTDPTCTWTEDCDGAWRTSCDHTFEFVWASPAENGFVYCPYCGKKIVEEEVQP